MVFSRRCIQKPRPVHLFWEPILWVYAVRCLGSPSYVVDLVVSHQPGCEESCLEARNMGPLLHRTSGLSIRNGVLLYKQLYRATICYGCPFVGQLLVPMLVSCR